MRIWFIDTVCPKPYSLETLLTQGMGGTEATVVRVAEQLGKEHEVLVTQHCRSGSDIGGSNVTYSPIKMQHFNEKWDAVVVVRSAGPLKAVREKLPDAKLFLWLHDLANADSMNRQMDYIRDYSPTIVCVSNFHKTQVTETIRSIDRSTDIKVTKVYNPIDDELVPSKNVEVDRNKLVFFSSPHKGFSYARKLFTWARNLNPDFKLYISNPGYFASPDVGDMEGLVQLGILPHKAAIDHVRTALCVFYPNNVFPETFGLVLAEANAVGTPVLTHPLGAAAEVLDHPSQLVDTRDYKKTLDRLMAWYGGNRPVVRGKAEFRVSRIGRDWINLFNRE